MNTTWWCSFFLVFFVKTHLYEWVHAEDEKVMDTKKIAIFDFLYPQSDHCNKCKCGIPNREARFLGGEYLTSHEFPWSALVYVQNNNAFSPFPATLINDRYLVTAANKVIGLTPLDMKIGLGQNDICFSDVNSVNASVDAIIVNPDFSPGNRAHDIALLKLTTPVKFTKAVQSICLAALKAKYLGQVATVSGWTESAVNTTTNTEGTNATTFAEGPIASTRTCRPRKMGLPVLGLSECQKHAYDAHYVSPDKGCIGVIGAASRICEVDSGGAVMYRNYKGIYDIIGILGDRNICDTNPSVALYTSVGDHLPWITENTKDACYCYRP